MNVHALLTPREEELSNWLVSGLRKKEIADQLCVSPRTVENTARNIYKKAEVSGVVELCIWWFCKYHNIPLSQSPLKKTVVAVSFILIFLPFEVFANQETLRPGRSLMECRRYEARRNDDHLTIEF